METGANVRSKMPRRDTFEFEGLEIARWVSICIIVAGLLIGVVFWIRGNLYNIHYLVFGTVAFFTIPYYLITRRRLKWARMLISFALPILMTAVSVLDKRARLLDGTMDPANFLDIRFILVCSLIFPIMITPLRPARIFWINVLPSVCISLFFDPIHSLFGVGYETTGLPSVLYYVDVNLFATITVIVLVLSIIYLKRKTALSIDRMQELVYTTEENAEQLNFMVENATQGTWKWSSEEEAFEWSDKTKRFLGTAVTAYPDTKIIDFIHPDDHDIHRTALQNTFAQKKIYNVEIRIKDPANKDAPYQWVQSLGEVIRNESGKIVKMLGLFIDINDRKNIQLELERRNKELEHTNATLVAAEKEKGQYLERIESQLGQIESKNRDLDQFAYVVSHDLKAPLRAINNLATWIEDDLGQTSPEVQENFQMLKSRVERLDNFIDGLLQYSRVERVKLDLEEVDMDFMVNEVIRSFSGVKVEFRKEMTFPTIKAYRVLMYQLFQNLISNAIKHNDKDNKVVELGYKDGKYAHEFWVTDNGPGIPPELREKVFKIFQTLKAKDEQENTGIGLSIVKKIIEEVQGTIEICDAPKGARFEFQIPKFKKN